MKNNNKLKYGIVWEKHKEDLKDYRLPLIQNIKDKDLVFDNEKNFNYLIEGDNYYSLKTLLYTHKNRIDMIYIDPPYNRGEKSNEIMIYNDNYVKKEHEWRHSMWLSLMEERLKLSKDLLSEKGVIFISIDHNELFHLKLLMDQLNYKYLATVIRKENAKRQKIGEPNIKEEHEYLLVFSKTENYKLNFIEDISYLKYKKECKKLYDFLKKAKIEDAELIFNELLTCKKYPNFDENQHPGLNLNIQKILNNIFLIQGDNRGLKQYSFIDENGEVFRAADMSMYFGKGNDYNFVNPFDSKKILKNPKYGLPDKNKFLQTGMFKENENGDLIFTNKEKIKLIEKGKKGDRYEYCNICFKETTIVDYKYYLDIITNPRSILNEYTGSDEKLMQKMKLKFPFPKPKEFIKHLINIGSDNDSIILDFFAGSGTLGHAVIELNKKNPNSNRRFILCTNNEVDETTHKLLESKGYYKGDPEYEKYGVCNKVTYPRLSKVIQGYEDNKGKNQPGIPTNLKYYKSILVGNVIYNDEENIRKIVKNAIELFKFKHDCYHQLNLDEEFKIFNGKDISISILIDDMYSSDMIKILKNEKETKKYIYVFSDSENIYNKVTKKIKSELKKHDISFIPIPEEILTQFRKFYKKKGVFK